ncbi:hypothetical protein Pan241w_37020 [Gimesia alba]|uniref:Uncharacterized protein n=2 Tax=Gimesia alba TaxID=2527973 RepID=A0A517RI99_9PLAN|nr:hypothetical protein Pan241w_37020 [Gimesia alba]
MHDEAYLMSRRASIAIAAGTLYMGFRYFYNMSKSGEENQTSRFEAPPESVNGCQLMMERLKPLLPCMECCGPDYPRDAWNHSCIHPHTAAYSCGCLYVPGNPNQHDHDANEVALCEALSLEMAAILKGVSVNLSEGASNFDPLFFTANRSALKHKVVSAELIRSAFNGAIYPSAKISVAKLEENCPLWESFVWSDGEILEPEFEENISKWRILINWFKTQTQLHSPVFVEVGDGNKLSEMNFGCVFPRLVVALTNTGSLVGVCAHAVQT